MDIHLQSFTIPHFPSLMITMSKPAYLAIVEHSPTKPVIIFVPSRCRGRLTVDDLMVHCGADSNPDCFLNIEQADLQPHLDYINDKGLVIQRV
jgi:pre-mRNA-splicing helicase BRR2